MTDGPIAVDALPDMIIHVVLIHHQDQQRVAAAKGTVALVAEALSILGKPRVHEVSYQPSMSLVPLSELARRALRQWRLERRWADYLGVNRRWVTSSGLLWMRLQGLLLSPRKRAVASRQAFVELALSAKHELAWRNALEDEADLLVVLEDDARATGTSIDRIRELLQMAMSEGDLSNSYIDLAGGLPWDALRYQGITRPRKNGIVHLTRAATNTACGYIMGSEVVARLIRMTTADPKTRAVPADWLINLSFLESSRRAAEPPIACLHSHPHALVHGSFAGIVGSSIRK